MGNFLQNKCRKLRSKATLIQTIRINQLVKIVYGEGKLTKRRDFSFL